MPRSVQIVPYYAQPHVHTYINDESFYSEDVAALGPQNEKPYDTLVITGADKGIDNKFVKLTDYGTKVELFGKANFQKYGQPSLQADTLLQNNQTNAWFMRVLPKNAQYANLAIIAHYRIPECIREDWDDTRLAAEDTTHDCEIKVLGGTPDAPVLTATGLKQLEVKYSVINLTRFLKNKGIAAPSPLNDSDIEEFLNGKVAKADGSYAYSMHRGPVYTSDQAKVYRDFNGKARTPADLKGFSSAPLFYVRSIGRGKYGNKYAIRLQREVDFEYDHDIKAYGFGLIERDLVSKAKNYFVGSMVTSGRYDTSTLIDDVVGSYPVGSCPIYVKTYDDTMRDIFENYRKIVAFNSKIIAKSYPTDEERLDDLEYALGLVIDLNKLGNFDNLDRFDPVFGYRLNDKVRTMPFYTNFIVKDIPYSAPDLTLANYLPTMLTPSHTHWDKFVSTGNDAMIRLEGEKVQITNFLGYEGEPPEATSGDERLDKVFRIKALNPVWGTGTPIEIESLEVTYDEGHWVDWNEHEYNGVNLGLDIGHGFAGGYDGEFEEILAKPKKGIAWSDVVGDEVMRAPTEAEMKLLLSREFVSALRGEKDKYILSPARINLDFIFDANYNICADLDSSLVSGAEKKSRALFANSNVLTNEEYHQLHILDTGYQFSRDIGSTRGINTISDMLNVKKALYELNNYRNKNGMVVSREEGAGCELKLDCGLVGLSKTSEVSTELKDLLKIMAQFDGRNASIDFGHYEIIDPITKRKIPVTAAYFLAERLIPHIVRFGPNKPFVNLYAQIENKVRNSFKPELDLIDWDVKELLYVNRINYYLTLDEGNVVQRACQNTCQKDASAMLEENNVRVLNILKKGLERACRSYLYEWNDPVVRKGYTDTQMEIYKPWVGTWVEDLTIRFEANEYEQERMIMHCYVDVKFRDIVKRITVEIDISKPTRGGGN